MYHHYVLLSRFRYSFHQYLVVYFYRSTVKSDSPNKQPDIHCSFAPKLINLHDTWLFIDVIAIYLVCNYIGYCVKFACNFEGNTQ